MALKETHELQTAVVPIPDPTLLTTAALKGSIENLKEYFERVIIELDNRTSQRIELTEKLFNQMVKSSDAASAKQDAYVDKQVEAIRVLLNTNIGSAQDKITALKERIDRGVGKEDQQGTSRTQNNWMVGLLVIAVITSIGVFVDILALYMHNK